MADLSKIKLNGTIYNIKDAVARDHSETMENVKAMLAKYALDTTTVYTAPTADTAQVNGTVVPE